MSDAFEDGLATSEQAACRGLICGDMIGHECCIGVCDVALLEKGRGGHVGGAVLRGRGAGDRGGALLLEGWLWFAEDAKGFWSGRGGR